MLDLPEHLAEKAASFPECSYGACRANLVLASGEIVPGVTLAWGKEIIQVDGRTIASKRELGFKMGDVVDVVPE